MKREREREGENSTKIVDKKRKEKKTDKAVSNHVKNIEGEKTEGEDTKRNNNITFSVFTNISMS